ncbi:unnamed protein product [Prorocentrum cordatum]|nr:unnamed protein product [Polarella glacialis]
MSASAGTVLRPIMVEAHDIPNPGEVEHRAWHDLIDDPIGQIPPSPGVSDVQVHGLAGVCLPLIGTTTCDVAVAPPCGGTHLSLAEGLLQVWGSVALGVPQ